METNKPISWDQMIEDARERIKELRYSIKVFTERKNAGDSCPPKSIKEFARNRNLVS